MHRLTTGSRFSARSIRRSASAVIAATALVGTLAACSKDDLTEASTSSSDTATSMTSTKGPSSKAPTPSTGAPKPEDKDKDKDKDKDAPKPPPPAPAPAPAEGDQPAPPPAPQPVPGPIDANAQPPAPVEGGKAASPAEQKEIRGLLGKLENGNLTAREYYRTILDSTCKAQLDAHPEAFSPGQINQIPEIPMNTQPNLVPSFSDVKDYKVQGDDASATVTVTANGQTETSTMRFKREGGQWKFCS